MSPRKPSTLCPRCGHEIQFTTSPPDAFCPHCVDYLDNIERELAEERDYRAFLAEREAENEAARQEAVNQLHPNAGGTAFIRRGAL